MLVKKYILIYGRETIRFPKSCLTASYFQEWVIIRGYMSGVLVTSEDFGWKCLTFQCQVHSSHHLVFLFLSLPSQHLWPCSLLCASHCSSSSIAVVCSALFSVLTMEWRKAAGIVFFYQYRICISWDGDRKGEERKERRTEMFLSCIIFHHLFLQWQFEVVIQLAEITTMFQMKKTVYLK